MSISGRRFAAGLAIATFLIVALAWRIGERNAPPASMAPEVDTFAAPA